VNAERLKGILEFLLKIDSQHGIQSKINTLLEAINQLSSNPTNQTVQQSSAAALAVLEASVASMLASVSPAQQRAIVEIKAFPFFSQDMVSEISHAFAKNGMTPAVVQQQVQTLHQGRENYLNTLRTAVQALKTVGVETEALQPGQAEIGFMLPRELFHNELDGFQRELRTLNSIIRTFYEVTNVTPGPIEVRQIFTSDPIIFLGIDITVMAHVGHAVKWCVDTLKATMEIKKIIDMARAAKFEQPVVQVLEDQIQQQIEKCVKDKVDEILKDYNGPEPRKRELENPLTTSLEQILQRVERGMTVEIRLIPPVAKPDDPARPPRRRKHSKTSIDCPRHWNSLKFQGSLCCC
jgi:hypothetical protein